MLDFKQPAGLSNGSRQTFATIGVILGIVDIAGYGTGKYMVACTVVYT
jgi:hypothetical protein